MAIHAADQNRVVMVHESGTYAVANGAGVWPGLMQSHDIDENENVAALRYASTASRNVGRFQEGVRDYGGTFRYFLQDWRFLGFAMGSIVDGGSPTPYTHTLREVNTDYVNPFQSGNILPSFQLEDVRLFATGQNNIRTLQGCQVNMWNMTWRQGEPVSAEMAYVAQNIVYSSGAATAVTEDTGSVFQSQNVRIDIPSGTNFPEIKEFTFSINNNLDTDTHYLNGSRVRAAPIPGPRDYEITMRMNAEESRTRTLWLQYFQGGSSFNMTAFANISTGSTDAFITWSGCRITDMEMPTRNEGTAEATVTIKPQAMVVAVNDLIFRYAPF